VSCGRLLSEMFEVTTSDRILNSKSLCSMKIISKTPVDEKWIELTTGESEPLKNFPSILQENNPEVLASLVLLMPEN
jgi:hypothetical protein